MSFSRIYSAQTHLLKGKIVTVEVDITKNTLHSFTLVGLPDKAVDESKDRMSSALKNSGFDSPKNQNQKIVISLSPADLKKEGPYFDLAIALAYLLSAEEINFDGEGRIFLGELSLNGELRPIKGALPLTEVAKKLGFKEIFLPIENAEEAALVDGITIYGVKNLKEVIDHIYIPKKDRKGNLIEKERPKISPFPKTEIIHKEKVNNIDFCDIKGQEGAKRGLEIAASGGHNIAMSGPPGTGKTMLARVFSHILPDLEKDDCLEITGIHSIVGLLEDAIITDPPFRAPHHTASYVSMIGGGTNPKPGEVTLAHRGVLFLDEFPEFEKKVLESLRQPLEDNIVSISRARGSAIFPSNFILVAAMNPCPCGNKGNKQKDCICKQGDLDRYKRKLSGPIMDRIDIWVSVQNVDYEKLSSVIQEGEKTNTIKERVRKARDIQTKRFKESPRKINTNSEMNVKELNIYAPLDDETKKLLNQSAERLQLSARAYHRTIKLARTIADLEGSEDITQSHILEALQYRPREIS
ncbi:MAG TPA: magnesium chelatase [Lentisphaeria bacterium]|uniref:Mg chelatase-related protein n=1 Tax=Candidatus Nomurabacteria bacterium GW2011_GWE1_35_16 TaxID=1618761 RepID=A0A0G0B8X5_9BACT|nr:MAG: Mg chelatase-related protein [Candidatus Nomurabacteria bacterium GW2011_GWF1_34_20]KKP61577.1 MAG: Mg chelatase-related protein [Candidatus Nomurabacteria bacterium GW2011_GWE2_34_25]KKP65853.1 MAG: Mg chelatase-related protein [Candidatus Nomurabacteria bacterium GW2011_GWE1_35_16]KKP82834.1 MAG: Mg chelatase-related protein [Candidatus Nomurabacteria bacterium GW2011_GWF2_35_66]HAX65398.1 magnesium chelatase [Candidatus Nomurabacteria bacterium]HBM15116.1 magnesium chelatase [Lentis